MTNLFDLYETNLQKEADGVPVTFGDAVVYIASSSATGNPKIAKKQAEYISKKSKNKILDKDDSLEYMKELYAECVIVGWKNVKDREGKDIPYNKENALKLINDLPHFFDEVIAYAGNYANFRDEKIEEVAKN